MQDGLKLFQVLVTLEDAEYFIQYHDAVYIVAHNDFEACRDAASLYNAVDTHYAIEII